MDATEDKYTAERAVQDANLVVDAELNALGLDPFKVAGPVSLLHERARAAFEALRADRDRLQGEVVSLAAERDAYADAAESRRNGFIADDVNPSRLAALEQRVGALVAIVGGYLGDDLDDWEAMNRLAALRAPGEAPTTEQVRERLSGFRSDWAELTPRQREKFRAYDGPLNGGAPDPFRASGEGEATVTHPTLGTANGAPAAMYLAEIIARDAIASIQAVALVDGVPAIANAAPVLAHHIRQAQAGALESLMRQIETELSAIESKYDRNKVWHWLRANADAIQRGVRS